MWDALAGRLALYRVLQPERATACLRPGPAGAWRVGELRCKGNRRASAATTAVVSRWLFAWATGPGGRRNPDRDRRRRS